MPQATRTGDSTTGICNKGESCCPHNRSGTNTSESTNVFINGKGAHRLNDTGTTNCPHGGSYKSTSSSGTVFANGRGITRVGDSTGCTICGQNGKHSDGSPNVFIGG